MIQRIALLFVITGVGHGFSIIALKFIAQRGQATQVAGIAEIESITQLMLGLIGFGMQTDAIRNISQTEKWEEKLGDAQTARSTLSIFLLMIGIFSFYKGEYLYFMMAPILASSIDYALYARGYSVIGALVALVRVVVPLLLGIISTYNWPEYILHAYVIGIVLAYLSTNTFMSLFLRVQVFYLPSFNSLQLYLKTIPLGIINLCFYFFGLGFLLFTQLFYQAEELVVSFLALKFYLVYKGAIRVIHQAFVNQMVDEKICLGIDQICIMIGLAFFGSVVVFPNTFVSALFGNQFLNNQNFFLFLGASALTFSIFSSATTRVLLERKDIPFMKIAIGSVGISAVLLLILFQFSKKVEMITLSLLAGELFFSCSLAISFFNKTDVWNRISFLMKCALGLCLPILAKIVFGESLVAYLASFSMMGLILLLFFHKKFALPVSKTL